MIFPYTRYLYFFFVASVCLCLCVSRVRQNMRLGIDAVGAAGGVIEAAMCYTGDISDTSRCVCVSVSVCLCLCVSSHETVFFSTLDSHAWWWPHGLLSKGRTRVRLFQVCPSLFYLRRSFAWRGERKRL